MYCKKFWGLQDNIKRYTSTGNFPFDDQGKMDEKETLSRLIIWVEPHLLAGTRTKTCSWRHTGKACFKVFSFIRTVQI